MTDSVIASRTKAAKRPPLPTKSEIGWCELVNLPDLDLHGVHAKMDSGAATSSIHATRIRTFDRDGREWVEFWFRPFAGDKPRRFEAPLVAHRLVRSSNGERQQRPVIETQMCLGKLCWKAQLTLANRRSMAFPVLVGRRALKRGRLLINSGRKWVLGKPEQGN